MNRMYLKLGIPISNFPEPAPIPALISCRKGNPLWHSLILQMHIAVLSMTQSCSAYFGISFFYYNQIENPVSCHNFFDSQL